MNNIIYNNVPYSNLSNWINTNVKEPIEYSINITGSIPIGDMIGDWKTSLFGKKFINNVGAIFNIAFSIPKDATNLNFCFFDVQSLKTVHIKNELVSLNAITATNIFSGCTNLTEFKIDSGINIISTQFMFSGCTGLKIIDLSNLINSKDTSYMFNGCTNLETVINSDFTKSKDASYMFSDCKRLVNIDTSTFTSIENGTDMFTNCESLQTINPNGFLNLLDGTYMFSGCLNFKQNDFSDIKFITEMTGMFDNCKSLRKIKINSFNELTDFSYTFNGCNNLETVTLPDIRYDADLSNCFKNCDNLKTICISESSGSLLRSAPNTGIRSETMFEIINNKEIEYVDVPYSGLQNWLEKLQTPGEYYINITGIIPISELKGQAHPDATSPFGLLFNKEGGYKFNLRFGITLESSNDNYIEGMFYNVNTIKSVIITDINRPIQLNYLFKYSPIEEFTFPPNTFKIVGLSNLFGSDRGCSIKKVYVKDEKNKKYVSNLVKDIDKNKIIADRDRYINYKKIYNYMVVDKGDTTPDNYYVGNLAEDSNRLGGVDANKYALEESIPVFKEGQTIEVGSVNNLPSLPAGFKWVKVRDINIYNKENI